ncbi:hypothetical protein H0H92_012647, partial [Tricholoma furcatifolium]
MSLGEEVTPRGRDVIKRTCDSSNSSERASKVSKQSDAHSSASSARATSVVTSVSSGHNSFDGFNSEDDASPQGSSRATGGIIRGRAVGNTLNVADFDILANVPKLPVEGKVLLYDSREKTSANPISFSQPITNDLGQVLNNLSILYSPIKKNNSHIFVEDEDGLWTLKGKFDYAVQSKETLKWNENARKQYNVALLAEGLNTVTVSETQSQTLLPPAAIFAKAGSSNSEYKAGPSSEALIDFSGYTPIQSLIIQTLRIAPFLLNRQNNDLRYAYIKYEKMMEIQKTVRKMAQAGEWINE